MSMGESNVKTNDLIVSMAQERIQQSAIVAGTMTDVSSLAVDGLTSIEFPYAPNFTVKKLADNASTTDEDLTYIGDKLELDQHAYVRFTLTKRAQIKSAANLELDAIENAAMAHGEDLDAFLLNRIDTACDNAGGDHVISVVGAGLGKSEIVQANAVVKAARKHRNIRGNMFMQVNAALEADMLEVEGFIDASKYGSNVPVMEGEIGKVYGTRVIVTESGAPDTALVYHRGVQYWGLQAAPDLQTLPDLEKIGTKYVLDQLYGSKIMLAQASVPFAVKILVNQ